MVAVTIEESDEERSIVTPELRLRFRWIGDRWAHAIDIRPGPWQTAADSIEGGDGVVDPVAVGILTYQEIHFQREGDNVLALALGRTGPHHCSAAFRVSHRAWEQPHFRLKDILQQRSRSLVEIDVADRCRIDAPILEARYQVHAPPIVTHLGDSGDAEAPDGYHRGWRSILVWEAAVENNYDVVLEALPKDMGARVAILDRGPAGDWHVRVAAAMSHGDGTARFSYTWEHHRVRVIHTTNGGGEGSE